MLVDIPNGKTNRGGFFWKNKQDEGIFLINEKIQTSECLLITPLLSVHRYERDV